MMPSSDGTEEPTDSTSGRFLRHAVVGVAALLLVAAPVAGVTGLLGGGITDVAGVGSTVQDASTTNVGGPADAATAGGSTSSRDPREIAYGETVAGALDEDDPRSPDRRGYHDPVTFEGSAGDVVTVGMFATNYSAYGDERAPDTYLLLVGPDGEVLAANDDAGRTLNSRIRGIVLPSDGEYTVVATSYDADATFDYRLSLSRQDADGADLRSIAVNETATGEIDKEDPYAEDRRGYYEPVTFDGEEGQRITVEMSSVRGDTYLMLVGPDGEVLAANDDTGYSLNSSLGLVTLPEDGEYTVVATSFSSFDRFEYSLTVESGAAAGGEDLRSIEVGETAEGAIDPTDPRSTDRRGYYEPVTFDGEADQQVSIEMTSEGDTYLQLVGPDGEVIAEDDDGGEGLNSRLLTALPADGEYTIVATSFGSEATFPYELSLSEGDGDAVADLRSIEMNETAEGAIDPTDPRSEERRGYYEPVTFDGEADQRVSIEMTSEGDTYLMLVGPDGEVIAEDDDGGEGLNSDLETTLPADGEYTIVATSFSDSATFTYELSVSTFEPEDGPDLRSIAVGETATGAIDELDPQSGERRGYYEPVTFDGTEGRAVEINMTSEGDTYLQLVGPDGEVVAENDDARFGDEFSLNSSVETVLPEDGEYTIVATSFSEEATFEYRLSVSAYEPEDGPDLRSIDLGETATGAIDELDPRSSNRRGYYEPVTFDGTEGQAVEINMTSEGDTYLQLVGPDGEVIAENDDARFGGEYSLNSSVETVLPEDGEYTIVATSFSDSATFEYELSLSTGRAADGTDLRSIAVGESAEGELDEADPRSEERRGYHEPVTFEGEADQAVTIEMTSERGDTYLLLVGPGGEVIAENDDVNLTDGNLNSRIETTLPVDGEYTIVATSFADSETFEYELSVSEGRHDDGSDDGTADDATDLRSISVGESAQGELDEGDPQSQARRGYFEPVTFEGEAGESIAIEMTSDRDTYLMLVGPDGEVIAENDDVDLSAGNLNSRIETELPEDGEYTVVATSFDYEATFTYELSVERID